MSTRRHFRHSTEFEIRLVQSYMAGEGTINGLARQHGICHSLLHLWIEQYRKGYSDEKDAVVEEVREYEAKIAAQERKVCQITMEIDILIILRAQTSPPEETPSIISGPAVSPSSKGAAS